MVAISFYLSLECINSLKAIDNRIDRQAVEYQFVVTDSMMTVYNDNQVVGTVKIQGQLDSLLVDYNQ